MTIVRRGHENTEHAMLALDGAVTTTIGARSRDLRAGDVWVVNRGVAHELHPAGGDMFIEALGQAPLDRVLDPGRGFVLGDLVGSLHVDR